MVRSLRNNVWQVVALVVLIGAIMSSGGGRAALGAAGSLARWIVPAVLVYIGFRFLGKKLRGAFGIAERFQKEMQRMQQTAGAPGGRGPVIDICGKCGREAHPGRSCRA